MKLVLFDIDGTLLSSGMAGSDAMTLAFAELFQIDNAFHGIKMSGKTDPAILREAMANHGLQEAEHDLARFHERYVTHLRRTLQEPGRPRRLMPGIPHLLEVLRRQSDLVLGLLTGNGAMGAQLKLESFGLWHYFCLGAYGSDSGDRNALVPIAQERVQTLVSEAIPAERVFVIGDTPRDIACAQVHGAQAVAVATGSYDLAELQQHQPEYCFPDLGDIAAVLRVFTDT